MGIAKAWKLKNLINKVDGWAMTKEKRVLTKSRRFTGSKSTSVDGVGKHAGKVDVIN